MSPADIIALRRQDVRNARDFGRPGDLREATRIYRATVAKFRQRRVAQ